MSAGSSATPSKQTKIVRPQAYATHQRFEIEGNAYQLTFVRGTSSISARFRDENGNVQPVPADLLDQHSDTVNFFKIQGYTAVRVRFGGNETWGLSFCSHSEPEFNRAKGQRRALASALQNLTLPRHTRKSIWAVYNQHNPIPFRSRPANTDIQTVVTSLVTAAEFIVLMKQDLRRKLNRSSPDNRKALVTLGWLLRE